MSDKKQRIAVLGATGSIGKQTLEVIAEHNEQMQAIAISVNQSTQNIEALCKCFSPRYIGVKDASLAEQIRPIAQKYHAVVLAGEHCNEEIVAMDDVDTVVMGITGMQAIFPLLQAIKHHKPVALANKECIVCGGEWMQKQCKEHDAVIYPVDSEQSAIFQCLQGIENKNEVANLILTASGGPFRDATLDVMKQATPQDALKHPNWSMGQKISIDSATMINKGLEVIEASYLFDVPYHQIDVFIHPQSIVHSMVELCDGTIMAQMGCSDMRLPIQYALSYPNRIPLSNSRLDLSQVGQLTFLKPDMEKFRGLQLAYDALKAEGTAPAIYNASNEVAVESFLKNQIGFMEIPALVEESLQTISYHQATSLDEILEDDQKARRFVSDKIARN